MLPRVVIWGSSGHAMVVADIITLQGQFEIAGFLDDVNKDRWGTPFLCSEIIGGKEVLNGLNKMNIQNIIFGFGNCEKRLELNSLVQKMGLNLITAIHPSATVAKDVIVGKGTVIAAGAVINPGSIIGENVIINTAASVDHECIINNGVHISPGTHLGGRVTIGEATWVGIGSVIKDHISIGEHSMIGAGSVVLDNIPPNSIAYGVPAKIVREVKN
jgi:acetyltransferase EpsM